MRAPIFTMMVHRSINDPVLVILPVSCTNAGSINPGYSAGGEFWNKYIMFNSQKNNTGPKALSKLSSPYYRPDIDGLRAVAVLSVVAFHAFPSWMRGGFIGVDVFFVISGYLISKIILEGLEQQKFSFYEFYGRRIKRLFPSLLVVLATCIFFGWFVLLPNEYEQLGKHTFGGATFLSNFVLWNEASYFDNSGDTKPLLHLWSLGIEEQFYIVWPLLLWFFWKRGLNIFILTMMITAFLFYLNLKGVKQDLVATFYSPLTRFWELLCGSLLAWISLHRMGYWENVKTKIDRWIASLGYRERAIIYTTSIFNLMSAAGLGLLIFGFWRINKQFSYPGIWAVVPVSGAMLIIAAGPQAWLNRIVLSNKIAVWFGLISFPLYLWHWPILSFARIIESETPNDGTRFALVALSVFLAWCTYQFIERPIRADRSTSFQIGKLILMMSIIGLVGYIIQKNAGFSSRTVASSNYSSVNSGFDGGAESNMISGCGVKEEYVSLFHICSQDKRGNVRFALMGDSKADALYTGLVRKSDEQGRWLVIGGTNANGAPWPASPNFQLTVIAMDAITGNKNIDTVVLATSIRSLFQISDGIAGGRNESNYDYKYLEKVNNNNHFDSAFVGLSTVVANFGRSGKKVVLLVDNPVLPLPQDCIQIKRLIKIVENPNCYVPLSKFNSDIETYRALLKKVKEAHTGYVSIFDPTDIYCDASTKICGPLKDGRRLYSHSDHISDFASGLVAQQLKDFLWKNFRSP